LKEEKKTIKKKKLGMILVNWLPIHGGAEVYQLRLCHELISRGFDVSIFTSTPSDPKLDNGDINTTRWGKEQLTFYTMSNINDPDRSVSEKESIFLQYEFMNAAAKWATESELDFVLLGNNMNSIDFMFCRELYKQLQASAIKVGILHHDIYFRMRRHLAELYKQTNDWESAAQATEKLIGDISSRVGVLHTYFEIGSPLIFEPDFIISNSSWSTRFIDPFGVANTFILHPIIPMDFNEEYEHQASDERKNLSHKNILMINPKLHKGGESMVSLIREGYQSWTYRVLNGGFENTLENFIPRIEDSYSFQNNNVELESYVPDMREAYSKSDLVFFPSYYEGYGMAAIEPMYMGTPSVCSSYPAILEAVGDAALTVCPFTGKPGDWRSAVADVLENREYWKEKAKERASFTSVRQARELDELTEFLSALL